MCGEVLLAGGQMSAAGRVTGGNRHAATGIDGCSISEGGPNTSLVSAGDEKEGSVPVYDRESRPIRPVAGKRTPASSRTLMPVYHHCRRLSCIAIALWFALAGAPVVAQDEATPPASPVATPAAPAPTPGAPVTEDPNACIDGRLRIRDLSAADEHLADGIEKVTARGLAWQADARLVELRLSCPLLKTGLQWEGSFFSATAQATFATDTSSVEPSEDAPDRVPYLDPSNVSFQVVHRSLLRAGFSDDLRLAAASSVTVRYSSDQHPFGPPTAPHEVVYVHVAVEERGVIKDVWINAQDGTIYRYDLEG
jgi:hypothetical protein